MSEENNLIKVTFIIDNTVVDNMNTDDRWAAILLSNPTVVETTGLQLTAGDIYNPETGKFTRPEQIIPAYDLN